MNKFNVLEMKMVIDFEKKTIMANPT